MSKRTYDRETDERMTPLLRSITRELCERRQAIPVLEHEFALARRQGNTEDASRHQAELSGHKRELRQITKELARLGLELDSENGPRILVPNSRGAWPYEAGLGDTLIFPRPAGVPD